MTRLPTRRAMLRTATLAGASALPGCSLLDGLFESHKPPLPGKREPVLAVSAGLQHNPAYNPPVTLPPPVQNTDWSQAGGTPSHSVGNVALGNLTQHWRRSIGEGGGYRRKITATPVVAGGRVFTMDSDGNVSAFNVANGERYWQTDTQPKHDQSTNIGGGLAIAGGVLYASTGRGEAMIIDPATGKIGWRTPLLTPARSAPLVADGRLFVPTIDQRLVALAVGDGKQLWSYQATDADTTVLGEPAPAYADGVVVAGFGSGDLVALRAASGTSAWSDSLAAARGRNSLTDLSAIRAMPVINKGVVYAAGEGGLIVAFDLRSGRRLWEREAAGQNTPWIAGDWMFVLTLDQVLACIALADGQVRWTSQLPRFEDEEKSKGPIYWTGPLLGGQYLYVAGSTEKLVAVNPVTGEVLGQQDLPSKISVAMSAAMGKLFIVTDDGTLSALG